MRRHALPRARSPLETRPEKTAAPQDERDGFVPTNLSHTRDQVTEKWPDGFDENDGGTMRDLGNDQLIYLINYDNAYHLRYRVQQRGDLARDVVTEKYILGMRIMMLGYEHALRMRAGGLDGIKEYVDDFRRMAARGAASTVLALAENLPRIVDKTSVAGEAE